MKTRRPRQGALGEDELRILCLQPDEEMHRRTIDGIARSLAAFTDQVLEWCESHPEEFEEGKKWFAEYRAKKQAEAAAHEHTV